VRPRIAIPIISSRDPEYVARAMPKYKAAIEQAGGEALEVPLDLHNHEIARLATLCDGVLLPGSDADVNPEKYDATRGPHTADADPPRDNVDELLLQDAYNMRKPVLGVCFGIQTLNVWRSGTLVQHIESAVAHRKVPADQKPQPVLTAAHAEQSTIAKNIPPDHDEDSPHEARHAVDIEPGSMLAEITGAAGRIRVNSSHHQAVERVGDGLRVVARCPEDGVIEAVEGTAPNHFVLGVQWHPERMASDSVAQAIFRAFVQAARQRHHSPRTATVDFESVES
jgi:putative glutamine amidotransferase